MKSNLSSNVNGVIKPVIFFASTINVKYKIIFRNQKFEPMYQIYDSNESASL